MPASGSRALIIGGIDVTGCPDWIDVVSAWLDRTFAAGVDAVLLSAFVDDDRALDPAVVLGALSITGPPGVLGVAATVGGGRSASVMAREVTTLDHLLPAGTALALLGGTQEHRVEAEAVVTAMLGGDGSEVTIAGSFEHVDDAPNRPGPRHVGGPMVLVVDLEHMTARRHGVAADSMVETVPVVTVVLEDLVAPRVGDHSDESVVFVLDGPCGAVERLRAR